jgi:cytoskeleton protein RodZ
MTEAVTQAVADNTREPSSVAVEIQVGRQLENARKAMQLSVGEVAQRVCLGEKQILALETGDLAALPGKTFVRGFVRNYARAVQLDPEPLLRLLDSADTLSAPKLELPESTHVAMPYQEQGRDTDRDLLTVAAGLVLVVIAAALYFFLPEQFIDSLRTPNIDSKQDVLPEPTQPFLENVEIPPEDTGDETLAPIQIDTPPVATVPTNAAPVPNAVLVPPPQLPAVPQQAPTAPKPPATPVTPAPIKPTPAPAASTAPAPPAAATTTTTTTGNGRVHFTFNNASWVEVRDRNGKALSSGQHPGGTQHEVVGAPPLTVIVGRASGVELRYQGKPVALRPRADSDIVRVILP